MRIEGTKGKKRSKIEKTGADEDGEIEVESNAELIGETAESD